MQLGMTRRILGRWPKQGEDWPMYVKLAARQAEFPWTETKVPSLDEALASLLMRWAGRLARLEA